MPLGARQQRRDGHGPGEAAAETAARRGRRAACTCEASGGDDRSRRAVARDPRRSTAPHATLDAAMLWEYVLLHALGHAVALGALPSPRAVSLGLQWRWRRDEGGPRAGSPAASHHAHGHSELLRGRRRRPGGRTYAHPAVAPGGTPGAAGGALHGPDCLHSAAAGRGAGGDGGVGGRRLRWQRRRGLGLRAVLAARPHARQCAAAAARGVAPVCRLREACLGRLPALLLLPSWTVHQRL
mmetsp:Transcript_100660/g.290816  ORF Transcript_100660/g.290816 Transcript_100660/m.290816 type:complete len:240 (+) Transcript_100660:165-884(+)